MNNFQERKFELLSRKFENMGQRIVNHQSGYLGLDVVGEGPVNRVGQEEQFPQGDAGDIAQALAYVQQIAETNPDDFARWAATSDILKKADSGATVREANVNRSGQTSDPVHYPYNADSSTPGAGKSVLTSELSDSNAEQLKRLEDSAKDLVEQHRMAAGHLKAKILHVSKL
jgi:hypothetical protein